MARTAQVSLARNPTLESVLTVEVAIREHGGEMGKYQIWKNLPRKMSYQTFQVIVDYLLSSGKIAIDRKGKLVWIWNPAAIRRLYRKGLVLR